MSVLNIEELTIDFTIKMGTHHVLKNANLRIERGEIVGLIGESGCRKSTLAMSVLDINSRNWHMSGRVCFMGKNIQSLGRKELGSSGAGISLPVHCSQRQEQI